MNIQFPFFGIQIQASFNILRTHSPTSRLKRARGQACNEAWSELLLEWSMAPEFIARHQDLETFLRLTLRGCALAIAKGDPSPLAALEPDRFEANWDWLAKAVTSPAAMSPQSPFFEARQALAKNFGSPHSCFDGTGEFRPMTQVLLQKMRPQLYAKAANNLGRRLHVVEIETAARSTQSTAKPRRL